MDIFKDLLLPGFVSLFLVGLTGALFKVFIGRAFKATDEAIKTLRETFDNADYVTAREFSNNMIRMVKLDDKMVEIDKEIVRLQEHIKTLESFKESLKDLDSFKTSMHEKFLPRGDFIREVELVTSQIEGIFRKIDSLDQKLYKDRK